MFFFLKNTPLVSNVSNAHGKFLYFFPNIKYATLYTSFTQYSDVSSIFQDLINSKTNKDMKANIIISIMIDFDTRSHVGN